MSTSFDTELGKLVNLAATTDINGEATGRLRRRLNRGTGPSSSDISGRWIDWASMSSGLGQPFDVTKIPMSKLKAMRRDPMIAFGLSFKTLPLIRASWYIKSEDAQRAAFVDECLRLIYSRYILGRNNCLSFGFSPGVKRFEFMKPTWQYVDPADPNRQIKEVWDSNADALVWKSFLWLDPDKSSPHFDNSGEFDGIDYQVSGTARTGFNFTQGDSGKPNISLDFALWSVNDRDAEFGSIYGYPLIGQAYRYWWSYWYKFGLSDRAFEKWADPPVIIYYPEESAFDTSGEVIDFSDVALSVGERLRGGANVAMPSSTIEQVDMRLTNTRQWEIEQLETTTDFKALIDSFQYLDVLKLRAMMVPEMGLVEGSQGQSSRNVAQVFGDKLEEAQAVLMEEIDYEINRYLIPQLLEANFGPGGPSCTKVTTGFDPQDVETMRAIVGAVANKNGDPLEVDMMEVYKHLGIPTLSPQAIENKLEEQAKNAELRHQQELDTLKQQAIFKGHKPVVAAVPGKSAGLNEQGLYYQQRESIELSDAIEALEENENERRSLWERLFGRKEVTE